MPERTTGDNFKNLKMIFQPLNKVELRLNLEKRVFLRYQVKYLGRVSRIWVSIGQEKVLAVKLFNPHECRRHAKFRKLLFVLTQFVPNSNMASLLTTLTRKKCIIPEDIYLCKCFCRAQRETI